MKNLESALAAIRAFQAAVQLIKRKCGASSPNQGRHVEPYRRVALDRDALMAGPPHRHRARTRQPSFLASRVCTVMNGGWQSQEWLGSPALVSSVVAAIDLTWITARH